MYTFFKTDSLFEMLKIILKKLRQEKKSISVVFAEAEKMNEFSEFLWKSYETLAHGIASDGFISDQNIVLDLKKHEKNVLIIVGEATFVLSNYEKILFIGDFYKTKYKGKYFSYEEKTWKTLKESEF